MSHRLVGYHAALVLNDPIENQWEGENILDDALAGGGDSEGPLNGAEHLVRRAEVEAARVTNWEGGSVR